MADPLPMLPRGRDRETQMLDEAVTAVLADPVLGPELDKLSSRLGQRFTSAVMGPQDEITCAQLMHAEAQRALAHIMIWSAKVSEEKWRSRLAAQCGHTLALISAGQALLAVVNDSVESGKHWDERKALHEAIRSASEPSIAKPADGAT